MTRHDDRQNQTDQNVTSQEGFGWTSVTFHQTLSIEQPLFLALSLDILK